MRDDGKDGKSKCKHSKGQVSTADVMWCREGGGEKFIDFLSLFTGY
jgi:hypothetical protein